MESSCCEKERNRVSDVGFEASRRLGQQVEGSEEGEDEP